MKARSSNGLGPRSAIAAELLAVGSRAIWTVVSIALAGVAVPTLRATTRDQI